MNYVIVTPAKNESSFIAYTLNSIVNQTVLPKEWIIVDDGSSDDTPEIIKSFIERFAWIKLVERGISEERIGGAKVVEAFKFGEKFISSEYDFIVKLDADLTLPENYFQTVIESFNADDFLGLCGGYCLNKTNEGYVKEKSSDYHIRGAFKAVRKECYFAIGGFKSIWHWDGIDEMDAMFKGWKTKVLDLSVIHHRPTSNAYNLLQHSYKSGYEAYKLRSNFFLVLIRALFRAGTKLKIKRTYMFLKGYFTAVSSKEKAIIPNELSRFINQFHFKRIFRLHR